LFLKIFNENPLFFFFSLDILRNLMVMVVLATLKKEL